MFGINYVSVIHLVSLCWSKDTFGQTAPLLVHPLSSLTPVMDNFDFKQLRLSFHVNLSALRRDVIELRETKRAIEYGKMSGIAAEDTSQMVAIW